MKVFFSVGEPSGDLHGANLIRQLRDRCPDAEFVGYGGPRMAAAGCVVLEDLTRLAVMWFLQVFVHLVTFLRLIHRAGRYFREQTPDAVVLIDYPGFNWWIARKAKKHDIPVIYYGVPQMWAWAPWRVAKMRRLVDHVLCKLPFEVEWYRARDCAATYVGHPYFDELEQRELDEAFLEAQTDQPGPLVTILPGSRTQEVTHQLPWLLKAARRVHQRVPQARFAVACFNEKHADLTRRLAAGPDLPLEVFSGRTAELIHASHCCMACSGSVSLELLYHGRPAVILYWVNRLKYILARRWLVRVRYITLVNLLACEDRFAFEAGPYDPRADDASKVPYPEYPTYEDKSEQLAADVVEWLTDAASYEKRLAQLSRLKSAFAQPGASRVAADLIWQILSGEPAAGSATRRGVRESTSHMFARPTIAACIAARLTAIGPVLSRATNSPAPNSPAPNSPAPPSR